MQNQILGNNKGNSINGGASNSNNLGNINGLNSTLSRLTNSINQLNNAITKLNTFNQKSISTVQPQHYISTKSNNVPGLIGGGNNPIAQLIANRENELLKNERAIQTV
jgi:hypothetical protein